MASGKSSIAKALAEALQLSFVDTDTLIEAQENCSINQLFQSKGEEYFRQKETQVLQFLSTQENCVIAAGGGTPCFSDNIEMIRKHFFSIFLDVREAFLIQRLAKESSHRPLLQNITSIDDFVRISIQNRRPYYENAKYKLVLEDESVDEIVSKLIQEAPWRN